MTQPITERRLWAAFTVLFGVLVGSVALPVRPLVFVFPFWAVVVIGTVLATLAVALSAARFGWPAGVSEA